MVKPKGKGRKDKAGRESPIQDEKYRLLFETSSDAIMLLDRERFFDCNRATLDMFGLTKEEFIKRHPSEISPSKQANGKDSREEADRRISEAYEKGVNRFGWIHRRANGEDFPVTVWLTKFPLEGKMVLQATVREICHTEEEHQDVEAHRLKLQLLLDEKIGGMRKESEERKKAESEVRRLIRAVEGSFNTILLIDADLNLIYGNRAFSELAEIPLSDARGKNIYDFLPKASIEKVNGVLASLDPDEENRQFELEIRTATGKTKWIEVSASTMFDENGEPESFLAVVNDITERRSIQNALTESELKFKTMVESAVDGIVIIQDNNIAYLNPSMAKVSGYTIEDMLGTEFMNIVAPEDRPKVIASYKARMRGESVPPIYQLSIFRKDGARIPVEINATVMNYQGKPADFIFVRDLSERRKTEEALKASELLLREVMDNIPVRVFWKDLNLRYLGCNKLFAKDSGLGRPEDIIGKDDYEMGWLEQAELYRADDRAVIGSGKPKLGYEEPQTTGDGAKAWVRTSKVPLLNTAGETVGVLGTYEDITEMKKSNEEIRALKEQFEYVLGATNTGFDIIDSDLNVHYVDPKWAEKLGDYTGKKCHDYFMGRKTQCPGCAIPEALKSRKNVVSEEYLEKEKRHIEVHTIPFRRDDGEWLVAEFNIDITERKAMMKSLQESEEKFRNLAEHSPNMIFINSMGSVVYANRMAEQIMGYTREEFGSPDFNLDMIIHKDFHKLIHENLKRHFRGEDLPPYEYKLVTKDGKVLDAIINTKTIDYAGEPSILGIVTDITDRKKSENALRESEEKYRKLIETANDAIILADAKTGILIDANQRACELVGRSRYEIIGMHQTELHPPDEVKRYEKLFKAHIKDGRAISQEIYVVHKDGRKIPVAVSSSVFELHGLLINQGIFHDLTERIATEKAIKASEQVYRSLYESTMALGELGNLTSIMEVIAEQARNMMDGVCSTIYIWNDDRKVLVPFYSNVKNEKDKFMTFEMPLGTGLTGHVAEAMKGAYANYNDPEAKKGYVPGTGKKKDHLQSIIAEPLVSGGKLLGVINVIALERVFNDDDLAKLRILASQTSIAYIHTNSLEKLLKSEERFRKMGESIHDGLVIIEKGVATYINERAVEIYGYPADELKNMSHLDLVIPEDREQMHQIMDAARTGGQIPGEIEFWVQGKDGSRKYVRTRISTSSEGDRKIQFIITTDITSRKLAEDENKRKLMKYLLDDGRIYLVKEFKPTLTLEALNDLLNLDYIGLVISRTPKKDLLRSISGPFEHLWLGEQIEGEALFAKMLGTIGGMKGKGAIMIERLDYLMFKYGFKETLGFIFRLRDQIYLREQVVIVSVDPSTLKEDELNIMQKEMSEIELRQVPRPGEELMEIAQLIYDRNSAGIKPSFSEIGEELSLSKPTFRKRVRRLISSGYAVEVTKGNRKVLELTQKGRSLFFK